MFLVNRMSLGAARCVGGLVLQENMLIIGLLEIHVLKDRVLLDDFKLGLEVFAASTHGRRVAATASLGHVDGVVLDFITGMAPG
jgi:hypothetical protein